MFFFLLTVGSTLEALFAPIQAVLPISQDLGALLQRFIPSLDTALNLLNFFPSFVYFPLCFAFRLQNRVFSLNLGLSFDDRAFFFCLIKNVLRSLLRAVYGFLVPFLPQEDESYGTNCTYQQSEKKFHDYPPYHTQAG